MNGSASPVILILEDEALVALDIEYSLQQAGLSPVSFARRSDAELWLEKNTPGAAVIDVRLPDGSCASVVEILKDRKIPFVIHTGRSESEITEFEPYAFLEKPCDPQMLVWTSLSMVKSRG